jgi:hypothetical protein
MYEKQKKSKKNNIILALICILVWAIFIVSLIIVYNKVKTEVLSKNRYETKRAIEEQGENETEEGEDDLTAEEEQSDDLDNGENLEPPTTLNFKKITQYMEAQKDERKLNLDKFHDEEIAGGTKIQYYSSGDGSIYAMLPDFGDYTTDDVVSKLGKPDKIIKEAAELQRYFDANYKDGKGEGAFEFERLLQLANDRKLPFEQAMAFMMKLGDMSLAGGYNGAGDECFAYIYEDNSKPNVYFYEGEISYITPIIEYVDYAGALQEIPKLFVSHSEEVNAWLGEYTDFYENYKEIVRKYENAPRNYIDNDNYFKGLDERATFRAELKTFKDKLPENEYQNLVKSFETIEEEE